GEMAFFFFIHRTKRQYPGLIEMFIEKTLSRLENELGDAERKLDRLQDELKPYARFDELLHEALAIAVNSQQLTIAKTGISEKLDSRVFVVEGWVSETNLKRAFEFAEELDVVAEEIKIEESDPVPTCLENEGYARIGEDLVHIYDTPSTNDKDPSLWVLCFFAIFFAIIVGDSGYGLFLLLTGGYLYYKYPNWSGGMQRFRKLLMILASVCVLWGVGSHAFFGVQFDLDSPFRKYSLFDTLAAKKAEYHLNARDDVYKDWVSQFPQIKNTTSGREAMAIGVVKKDNKVDHVIADKLSDAVAVEIALLLGVIHITISFFRNLKGSWAGIGWVFVLWGGYFYCASYLGSINMGNYLLGIPYSFGEIYGIEMSNWGLIAAVVLSLIQNRLMGLLEITVVIQLFADVLSYLRLYALGLSGSILSSTVNDMAMALSFGGGIVLLLGHAINILLAIMGGVIHGLRLNFLEWYHYSFEGGGRLFKPLRLIDSDYQNKRGR
ncbi:MAG: V-type ATP synthase subunit I, partial [Chlamydiia bacterium]|nr:V-type ATP synthase subunit I [Chlamydiia bacterium]